MSVPLVRESRGPRTGSSKRRFDEVGMITIGSGALTARFRLTGRGLRRISIRPLRDGVLRKVSLKL